MLRGRARRIGIGCIGAAGGAALACSLWRAPPPVPPSVEPPPCARIEAIEVHKSERRLFARCEGGRILSFPIALPREPAGAKRARGDDRSPEGDYHVAGAARPSRFHLFLPIDYPAPADADRALAEGRITPDVHAAILRAHALRRLPPQNTPLGGYLGLHGEGARWRGDLDLNWTRGCFALADEAIELLAQLAPIGTPVRILP
jgi:murein L,D-transpeptidase YafK